MRVLAMKSRGNPEIIELADSIQVQEDFIGESIDCTTLPKGYLLVFGRDKKTKGPCFICRDNIKFVGITEVEASWLKMLI